MHRHRQGSGTLVCRTFKLLFLEHQPFTVQVGLCQAGSRSWTTVPALLVVPSPAALQTLEQAPEPHRPCPECVVELTVCPARPVPSRSFLLCLVSADKPGPRRTHPMSPETLLPEAFLVWFPVDGKGELLFVTKTEGQ